MEFIIWIIKTSGGSSEKAWSYPTYFPPQRLQWPQFIVLKLSNIEKFLSVIFCPSNASKTENLDLPLI